MSLFSSHNRDKEPLVRAWRELRTLERKFVRQPSVTVDGSEILHQLRLVVYPIIYKVLYIQTVVVWDFFHQQLSPNDEGITVIPHQIYIGSKL